LLVVGILLSGGGWSGVSLAQEGSAEASAPEPRVEAQPIFNSGLELVAAQQWADALERFDAAFAIYPSPTIAFNIGYCQRALGRYVEALATFRSFLGMELTGQAESREAEAENYVRELEARLSTLILVVPTDQRAGLELLVDGRAVDGSREALTLRLDPGAHTVHARREGYQPLFVDRELGPGESARVEVRLDERPARLMVSSNVADAEVLLDGEAIGAAPLDTEIAPGRHQLEVRRDDYLPHRTILDVQSGDTSRVEADLAEEATPLYARWWFWGGVAVLVAGAVIATWALTRPEPAAPPYDGGNLDWVVGGP
jgi:hypothetical protein